MHRSWALHRFSSVSWRKRERIICYDNGSARNSSSRVCSSKVSDKLNSYVLWRKERGKMCSLTRIINRYCRKTQEEMYSFPAQRPSGKSWNARTSSSWTSSRNVWKWILRSGWLLNRLFLTSGSWTGCLKSFKQSTYSSSTPLSTWKKRANSRKTKRSFPSQKARS